MCLVLVIYFFFRFSKINSSLQGLRWLVSTDCGLTVNSLAPGRHRSRCHFKTAIFNLVLLIGIFTSFEDDALRWMPRDLTDDKSTLVKIMTWCRQATSLYLSQSWPGSISPNGVTRPQWVLKGGCRNIPQQDFIDISILGIAPISPITRVNELLSILT